MIQQCAVASVRSPRSRFVGDGDRLRCGRLLLEILVYIEANPVSTVDEIFVGLEVRVCERTIRRHVIALEQIGAIEASKVDGRKCYETTGLILVATKGGA